MIQNIRDLGGIRTGKGKTIRHGCLVRSANLVQAEAQDLEGITAVIDLRISQLGITDEMIAAFRAKVLE